MQLLTLTVHVVLISSQEFNVSNNQLRELPALWTQVWGAPHATTGVLTLPAGAASTAVVNVLSNPLQTAPAVALLE